MAEVRAIHPRRGTLPPLVGFFDNDQDAQTEAQRANAHGYNLYFGLGARRPELLVRARNRLLPDVRGGSNDDIVPPAYLLIDIDVDTPRRRASRNTHGEQAAATDEEIRVAYDLLADLLGDPLLEGCTPGISFTGNGFAVLVPVLVSDPNDMTSVGMQMKAFGDLLRSRHTLSGCKIDSTFDLARISAFPGTVKYKGTDPALYRTVQCFQMPAGAVDLEMVAFPTKPALPLTPTRSGQTSETTDSLQWPTIPDDSDIMPLLEEVEGCCSALRRIIEEVSEHPTEGRSGLLYHLAGLLSHLGLDNDQVEALLLWHDARCGRKFVGRRYPGWYDYLTHLMAGTNGYQGNPAMIQRLLGTDACSACEVRVRCPFARATRRRRPAKVASSRTDEANRAKLSSSSTSAHTSGPSFEVGASTIPAPLDPG